MSEDKGNGTKGDEPRQRCSVQCFYCRRKDQRKRDCRKRVREQGSGQEALAEDAALPSCKAYDKDENSPILMLGFDSLRYDGS